MVLARGRPPPTLGSERLAAFPVARIGRARVNESAMVDPARWPWQRRTRRRLPRRRPDPRKEPGLWNKVAGSLATRIGTRCFALYERPWPTGASGRKWPIRRCPVNRPPRRRKGWERSDRERTRGGDFRGHKVIGGDADRRLSDTRTAELTAVGGTVRVGVVSPLSRRLGLSVVEAFLPSRGQVSTTVGGRCSFR